MTPIGVITGTTYVLAVYAPGSRTKIRRVSESRRQWRPIEIGDVLSIGRERLRVTSIESSRTRRGVFVVHRLDVMTSNARAKRRGRRRTSRTRNVVAMPLGDSSIVADFLRCQVLVRVFGGDPEAWLAALRNRSHEDVNGGDVRFLRWIRVRLQHDPMLLAAIRRMVDAMPLWRQASG